MMWHRHASPFSVARFSAASTSGTVAAAILLQEASRSCKYPCPKILKILNISLEDYIKFSRVDNLFEIS